MDNQSMAAIASVANSQIGQHQQQQQQQPQHHPQYEDSPGGESSNGTKRKAEDGSQGAGSKSRRSRYISLACNECKRRKIKCNGQTPCQRCGNLNLECVYAPNCCNGFKDSQEYKDMAAHVASLQDQVNMLFDNLNNLRGSLGQPNAPAPQQIPQQPQQQQHALPPPQSTTPIDPSLQNNAFGLPQAAQGVPLSASPSNARQRSFSQQPQQPTYRGPTSVDFSFGVAKNSLQTMGITPQSMDENGVGDGEPARESSIVSPGQAERNMQVIQDIHEEKDPIYSVSKEEALRFCRMYGEEINMMYPVLDIEKVIAYTERLFRFIEAIRRSGFMQQGFPGADAIDDDDTIVLKMIIACASTMEGSGSSELGLKMFSSPGVQAAIKNALEERVSIKSIRLLAMTAMFEFHRDNEVGSWRNIGNAARRSVELGLHRHETYEAMPGPAERTEAKLVFWSVYILDRRFSFGTGMPFALQDTDVDPSVPKPEDRTSYLSAMARFCEISSRVWRTVSKTPTAANDGSGSVNQSEMAYLDYQVIEWHHSIPLMLKFEHPSQPPSADQPPNRGSYRLRVILYLRANQMRIHIYRPVLHSATSIMQNRDQAQNVVDVAKDTIRVLTHVSQTSDIYHTQQALFNPFLTGALAVLFLAVSHTPALYVDNVREEFYMALDLVRTLSKGSPISERLWKTIRHLKEIAPKLGMTAEKEDGQAAPQPPKQQSQAPPTPQSQAQSQLKGETDPSRSAAVAMAGLAGVDVNEIDLYNGGGANQQAAWSAATGHSSSPEGMANDLTSLFEAAGGLQAMGQQGHSQHALNGSGSTPSAVQDGTQFVENYENGLSHSTPEIRAWLPYSTPSHSHPTSAGWLASPTRKRRSITIQPPPIPVITVRQPSRQPANTQQVHRRIYKRPSLDNFRRDRAGEHCRRRVRAPLGEHKPTHIHEPPKLATKREYDLAGLSDIATSTSASYEAVAERRLSAALEKTLTISEIALDDNLTMSSSSQAPESWISAFCSLVGHEYFAEVSEDFIEDDFNLTGLQSQVPMYKEALEMILDVEPEDASDEEEEEEEDDDEDEDEMLDPEGRAYKRADAAERRHLRMASDLSVIESSAEMLYGLIHQRFITSRQGIQQMAEKYELGHFGHCPRVHCHGARVLPVGCSDIPGHETVKLFCPSCLDVYTPPNSRFQTVDGAFFGTTFGCLFFMTFPELDVGGDKPNPPPAAPLVDPLATGPSATTAAAANQGSKTARSSLSSSLTSGQQQNQQPPAGQPGVYSNSTSATANAATTASLPPQPENINGVTPRNLAPGLGYGNIYEPRIYGFRVAEVAKTGPRMKWLRSKPADANELDESALWAAQQAAKTAAAADADMPDQSQEVAGEIEDEDMEGAEGGVVGGVDAKTGKARKQNGKTNGESVGGGGAAVRVGGGGGG
ncbi:hypothetical protein Q7P37_001238 [Cladosporium fusiforme]